MGSERSNSALARSPASGLPAPAGVLLQPRERVAVQADVFAAERQDHANALQSLLGQISAVERRCCEGALCSTHATASPGPFGDLIAQARARADSIAAAGGDPSDASGTMTDNSGFPGGAS